LNRRAVGKADSDSAPASHRNLMGFLDAFKAAPAANAPSLTRCEDFA